jgi:hypothetical protein
MAENPLREVYEKSTPVFDSILGAVQQQTDRLLRNKELAKQIAQEKDLLLFKENLNISGQKELIDYRSQKQKELFEFEKNNTQPPPIDPTDSPLYLSIKDRHNMEQDIKNNIISNNEDVVGFIGLPKVEITVGQNEQGLPDTNASVYLQGVDEKVYEVSPEVASEYYGTIQKGIELKERVLTLMETNNINEETIEPNSVEGNIKRVGMNDLAVLLDFDPSNATIGSEDLKKIQVFHKTYGSAFQLNTGDVKKSNNEELRQGIKARYTELYKYSQPKHIDRLFFKDEIKNRSIGNVIDALQKNIEDNVATETEIKHFEKLNDLISNYGALGDEFIGVDPYSLFINPDASSVSDDITKIFITKSEYDKKINNQRTSNDFDQAQKGKVPMGGSSFYNGMPFSWNRSGN